MLLITSVINYVDFIIYSHSPTLSFPKPKSPNIPCVRKIKKKRGFKTPITVQIFAVAAGTYLDGSLETVGTVC
jgi:hypothetical protein